MADESGASRIFAVLAGFIRRGCLVVAFVLVATMLPFIPASAAPSGESPGVAKDRSVPVSAVKPRRPSASQTDGPGVTSASRRTLPKAGTADVAVTGKAVTVGGLPVRVSAVQAVDEDVLRRSGGRPPQPPSRVRVEVVDPKIAAAAGVTGALLRVSRSDGVSGEARARVGVDYTSFAEASGANFGQRLRLFELPSCVLLAPEAPACQARTDLGSVNKAGSLSADVMVGTGTFVALDATSSSEAGTFTATSLSPAYAWSAGGQGGEFSYTYPFEVPPAPGDLEPELALRYSSGAVDGRTLARNGQTSWIGEGWDLQVGYIERDYRPCSQDGANTGDLCWFSPYNATMVFNGSSTELVRDNATGVWKAADDDGLRIEKLNDTSLGNGDNDGEYWKVTAQDGTQYFFGRHKRFAGDTGTNSLLTVPVYGNNSGEPCFNSSGYAASFCSQGYRWQLDYVVDPHGNSMSYFYTKWGSYYGRNNNSANAAWYDMSAVLDHIDYGTRAGSEGSGNAPFTVVFGKTDRCSGACGGWADFPDTPSDLRCMSSTSCPHLTSPAFWSPWKLSTITTKVWDGGAYRPVDKWEMTHTFPATGDHITPSGNDTSPNLWLQTITHTGYAADGVTSLAEPTMTFGGTGMFNRVDWGNSIGVAPYTHYRLTSILTGTGGQTVVTYSGTECVMSHKPRPQANPLRCFPQYFTPQQAAPGWGWFHKYVVTKVVDKDLTGGSPDEETSYAYSTEGSTDRSLWHHDYAETSQLQYRSWPLWRGYTSVTTTKGAVGGTQTVSKTLYHRGMDGDGMASTDNQSMVWGARRVGITVPMGTPNAVAAVSGNGGLCVEIAGGGAANATNVQLGTCNGSAGQVWQVLVSDPPNPDGRFSLRNPASGKCLDIQAAGTANGSNVYIWTCNGQPQQMWQRQPDGSLRNPNSGRCMDAADWGSTPGANIHIYSCSGSWNQVWQPQPDGSILQPQPNRCMDVASSGTADGTKIQNWNCNGTGAQDWRLEPNGALRNANSNKCADITGGGTANGTLVQLYTCTGQPQQIWQPQPNGTLRNPNSGRCLDVASAANGTQLRIWDCNTSLLQQWTNRITDREGLEGRPREQFTLNGPTTILGSSSHEYSVTQTGLRATPATGGQDIAARMVREVNTRTRTWLAHSSSWRWTETQFTVDSYGLPTDVKDLGDTATTADDVCTHTDYARDTTNYLIDFPSAEIVTDCAANPGPANTLGGTRTYYDNSTTLGAPPTRGLPTQTSELASYAGTTANWVVTGSTTYDIYGRPRDVLDALNRLTTSSYSPETGAPVTTVTITNAAGHTASAVLGVRGQQVSTTDANGKTTSTAYDPLGRLTKVWLPGRTTAETPNTEYVYTLSNAGPNHVQTKKLGPNGNQISSFEIYDGRLRLRQTQTTAPDGKRAIADTRYDTRGLTVVESAFYNNASAPSGTLVAFVDSDVGVQHRYAFDAAGRKVTDALWSFNVEQWRTTMTYDGDRTNVDPPVGATSSTTILDARGRVTAIRLYADGVPFGGYDETRYSYDRLDRLTSVKDPASNTWSNTYDRRGHIIEKSDPDAGTSSFTYDNAGQLVTSSDSRGEVLHRTYDDLGRVTELRDDSATGNKRASWLYDTIADGHLTSATRWIGPDAYTRAVTGYTDQYQATGTTVTIPVGEGSLAGTYSATATYNGDGSLNTLVYAAEGGLPAETVAHTYSAAGDLTSVAGIDVYLESAELAWDGAVKQQILGSGNNQVRFTRELTDATRRLARSQVHTETPGAPGSWDEKLTEVYTYDAAGNAVSINETHAGATVSRQCFTHDHHRRLTGAWTTTASDCEPTPSISAVGGPDAYWQSFTYDNVGNRLTDTSHTTAGDVTRTYTYPTAGGARPHAPTEITTNGGGATSTFTYDDAGNLATRTTTGQPGQAFTFDAEGNLTTFSSTATQSDYIYDADGNRLIANNPTDRTLYVGDSEYRLDKTTNQVVGTRYYLNAIRSATGGLTWIATDHHGTGQVAIVADTLRPTHRRLKPFGETRSTAASWPNDKGFVGGTQDPSGYTHLGAREYDPTTGRFISVDPIMDLTDPQQMNGYTYANNNPVTFSDPDGYKPLATGSPHEEAAWEKKTGQRVALASNGKWVLKKTKKTAKPPFSNRYGRNGTVTTRFKSGKVAINGFVLPPGGPDADELAAQVDRKAKGFIHPEWGDNAVTAIDTAQIIYDLCLHAIKCGRKFMNEVFAFYWIGTHPLWPAEIALDMAGPGAGARSPKNTGGCRGSNSFVPGTPVLMGDGTTKRIDEVRPGDKVLAADPVSGSTEAKVVTNTIVGKGRKELVTVSVKSHDGKPLGTVVTTDKHPFWVANKNRWEPATYLETGSFVLSLRDVRLAAARVSAQSVVTSVYNLTVDDFHTYFVLAGPSPVLVHNDGACPLGFVPKITVDRHGRLTNGKYTLDSHGMRPHTDGTEGKSQFGFYVNSGQAVLDAAAYADQNKLWVGNKAKVPVLNGIVGYTGSGEPTTWINVYRTNKGMVHGSPGNPPK